MTGDVDFCVYDGHTRFDIHLHRNVTVDGRLRNKRKA